MGVTELDLAEVAWTREHRGYPWSQIQIDFNPNDSSLLKYPKLPFMHFFSS
jgi:hypothetical protein